MCVKFDFDTTMANPATFYSVLVAIQKILAGDFTVAVLLIHIKLTCNASTWRSSTILSLESGPPSIAIAHLCLPRTCKPCPLFRWYFMVYAIALYNDSSYRSQRLCPTGAHPALPGPWLLYQTFFLGPNIYSVFNYRGNHYGGFPSSTWRCNLWAWLV